MNRIDELKKVLDELPSLEERLRTWKPILVDIDKCEREFLELCMESLGKDSELNLLEIELMFVESVFNANKERFDNLIKRFELPIIAYKERVSELKGGDFKIKMQKFRHEEEIRCKSKAIELANSYHMQYNPARHNNQFDYMRTCESMVTGFLFQPGIYPTKSDAERKLFHCAFEGFNPNEYVILFCKTLKELFK